MAIEPGLVGVVDVVVEPADTADALVRVQGLFRAQLLALDPGLKLPF